jgi:membrane protein
MRWLWLVLKDAVLRFIANDGSAMAGYIAFAILLAMFPFVIVAVLIASLIIGYSESVETIKTLVELLPPDIVRNLEPMLLDVVKVDRGSVLTLSAAIGVWSASSGIEAFRTAFDRAYGVHDPRPWWLSRLISIGVVFVGAATFIVVGVAIVFAPLLIRLAEDLLEIGVPAGLVWVRYIMGMFVFVFFLLVLHLVLPPWGRARRLWPGVIVSSALWFVSAIAFSIYLVLTPTFSLTYGTMSGVVATMLFFYLSGAVIIFGAELNASLGRAHPGARAAGDT